MSTPTPEAMWNGMASWYSSTIAAANLPLAHSLLLQLGDLAREDLVLLETHNGDGRMAELVLKLFPSIVYHGCDFSSEMNELCKTRIKDLKVKHDPKIFTANSMELPLTDSSVDVYVSNFGGCCVADFLTMLKEALRVLKPGGLLGISVRNEGAAEDTFFRLISEVLQPHGYPPYAQREGLWLGHDPAKLRARAGGAGFEAAAAWKAAVVLPVRDEEGFLALARGFAPVAKCLAALDAPARSAAEASLREAAGRALEGGAIQVAAGCLVARRPAS